MHRKCVFLRTFSKQRDIIILCKNKRIENEKEIYSNYRN